MAISTPSTLFFRSAEPLPIQTVLSGPITVKPITRVRALPEREELEITFPRLMGYRFDLPTERLTAEFTADSTKVLSTEEVPVHTELDRQKQSGCLLNLVNDNHAREALDGPGLVEVLGWIEAARETRELWSDAGARARFAGLAGLVDALPEVELLRRRLASFPPHLDSSFFQTETDNGEY